MQKIKLFGVRNFSFRYFRFLTLFSFAFILSGLEIYGYKYEIGFLDALQIVLKYFFRLYIELPNPFISIDLFFKKILFVITILLMTFFVRLKLIRIIYFLILLIFFISSFTLFSALNEVDSLYINKCIAISLFFLRTCIHKQLFDKF